MHVRATRDDAEAVLTEGQCESAGVRDDASAVVAEGGLRSLEEGHRLARDHVHQRAALPSREDRGVRITSYNVCYTKLLRERAPSPRGEQSRAARAVVLEDEQTLLAGPETGPAQGAVDGARGEDEPRLASQLDGEPLSYNFV